MRLKGNVRVIKRDQRDRAAQATAAEPESRKVDQERECQTIVSSWVREHRAQMEQMQRNFRGLLREKGFLVPTLVTDRQDRAKQTLVVEIA